MAGQEPAGPAAWPFSGLVLGLGISLSFPGAIARMGLPWEHRQHGETEASGGDFVSNVVHLLEATAKMYVY